MAGGRRREEKDNPLTMGVSSVALTGRAMPARESVTVRRAEGPGTVHPGAIDPNPYQPRERFGGADDDALAESVGRHGILQPLLVRPHPDGGDRWQLIAGERRLKAALQAGLSGVPVRVMEADEQQMAEWAMVENEQRRALSAWEEARHLKRVQEMLERQGRRHSQDTLALACGIAKGLVNKRLAIANRLTADVIEEAGYRDSPLIEGREDGKRSIHDIPQAMLATIAGVEARAERVAALAAWTPARRGGRREAQAFSVKRDAKTGGLSIRLTKRLEELSERECTELYGELRPIISDLLMVVARQSKRGSVVDDGVYGGGRVLVHLPVEPTDMTPDEIRGNLRCLEPLLAVHRDWAESGVHAEIKAVDTGQLDFTRGLVETPEKRSGRSKRSVSA